ncbi:fasciclin domain-containing protein [Thiohalocapsa halophila]|nr:fasciclin domain-containing protein [Thiohalocapsa halophila]
MSYGHAHSPLPGIPAGAQRMPARGAPMLHPTVYWGVQPARPVQASTAGDVPAGDIVDVAVGAGSFDTLVQAVQAAGLVDTLKGDGPFTVFAPTDEAFAKIPEDQLEALLADKEALTAVLTYHVVPGKVMAADVVNLDSAETVQGGSIAIDTTDGVKVDGAKVVKTDIAASNGVIHVIDRVIMPN